MCLTMLTGCETTTIIDTSCDAFSPISYMCVVEVDSDSFKCVEGDTAETVKEIRMHNARYEELCG